MFREETVKIDIFKTNLLVVITDEANLVKEKFGEDFNLFGATFISNEHIDETVVICLNTNHPEFTVGLIAHECLHAANFIFDKICYKYDYDNDETACYLVEYMVKEVNRIANGS